MKHPAKLVDYQMERLEKGLRKLNLDFTENHLKKLHDYIDLLYSYNRRVALFSKHDEEILVEKHILPSLCIVNYISPYPLANWLDIGSGGGFPAVPVKIFLDNINLTLSDSSRKKALFLMRVVKALELKNTDVLNVRVETLIGERRFDLITALAVESPINILKTASELLAPSGRFIWIRGRRHSEEISGPLLSLLKELNLELLETSKLQSFYPSPRLYVNILRKSSNA